MSADRKIIAAGQNGEHEQTPISSSTRKKSKISAAGSNKSIPWTFPKQTLEDAIRIPKAIDEIHGGNPMAAADLAKAVGYNLPNDWRFKDLLRSANQYGMVSGSGEKATVSLERIGMDIIAPSDPALRKKALLEAFHSVEQFKGVDQFYGIRRLPEDEFFKNTLIRQFNVPRDRVDAFAEVFRKNIAYLTSFNARPSVSPQQLDGTRDIEQRAAQEELPPSEDGRVRQFLDTCFVMMPFGQWFDRYYQEIYVPAIKEAGFEPIRADELFTTGSVVEQIWEQISKSKVLLADLTDRNANVFYELGLAHAAKKPVIFTAAKTEDVPFDLRHLRVIIYDVREPHWATKLSRHISDYLKNAKSDPEKSIPQPFRSHLSQQSAARQAVKATNFLL